MRSCCGALWFVLGVQQLADGVIPNEYGLDPHMKLKIGSEVRGARGHSLGRQALESQTRDHCLPGTQCMFGLDNHLLPHPFSNPLHLKKCIVAMWNS